MNIKIRGGDQKSVLSIGLHGAPWPLLDIRGLAGGRGGCGRGRGRVVDAAPATNTEPSSSLLTSCLLLLLSMAFVGCDSLSGFGGRSGLTESDAASTDETLSRARGTGLPEFA